MLVVGSESLLDRSKSIKSQLMSLFEPHGCTNVEGTTVKPYTDIAQSDSAPMSAIAKQPVSIAIEADQSAFQLYSSGVLTAPCGTQLDHGVLLVGYGEANGLKFWKVRRTARSSTWAGT